jgi:hypothetical protein
MFQPIRYISPSSMTNSIRYAMYRATKASQNLPHQGPRELERRKRRAQKEAAK